MSARGWLARSPPPLALALAGCGDDDEGARRHARASRCRPPRRSRRLRGTTARQFDDATGPLQLRRLGRAGGPDPPGREARRVRRGQHQAARRSCTTRGWWRSPVDLRRQPAGHRRAGRHRQGRLDRRPGRPGREAGGRAPSRCRSAPTRARCCRACRPATEKAILANVRSSEPDVKGVVGQAHPGRRRRGLRLRDRRRGHRRQAQGDRAAEEPAAERGSTASRWSRERRSPRPAQDVHRRPARRRGPRRRCAQAGFEPPPR